MQAKTLLFVSMGEKTLYLFMYIYVSGAFYYVIHWKLYLDKEQVNLLRFLELQSWNQFANIFE